MVDVWLFTVDCFSSPCLFPACSLVPCYYIHLVCVKLKQLLVLGSILFSSQPNTTVVSYLLHIQALPSQNGHADNNIGFRALQVVDVHI